MKRRPWEPFFAILISCVLMSCTLPSPEDVRTATVREAQTVAAAGKATAGSAVETVAAAGKATAGSAVETVAAAGKATAEAAGRTVVAGAEGTAVSAGEAALASAKATAVAAGGTAVAAAKDTAVATGGTTVAAAKGTAVTAGGTAVADTAPAQTRVAGLAATAEAIVAGLAGKGPYTVDSDLTQVVDAGGPALDAAIRAIRPDSPLAGLGQTFVDAGRQFGLNAYFVAALAAQDSAWGTDRLAADKNNLYGYGATPACPYDCARAFASKQESVQTVMPLIKAGYLTPGGKYYNGATLRGMNATYTTDQTWKDHVVAIMNALAVQK